MMEQNSFYNILIQLTEELKSLWRIENHYQNDAATEEERIFWRNLKTDKENHIKELKRALKKYLE